MNGTYTKECRQWHRQTNISKHMDIVTYKLNRPRDQLSENKVLSYGMVEKNGGMCNHFPS